MENNSKRQKTSHVFTYEKDNESNSFPLSNINLLDTGNDFLMMISRYLMYKTLDLYNWKITNKRIYFLINNDFNFCCDAINYEKCRVIFNCISPRSMLDVVSTVSITETFQSKPISWLKDIACTATILWSWPPDIIICNPCDFEGESLIFYFRHISLISKFHDLRIQFSHTIKKVASEKIYLIDYDSIRSRAANTIKCGDDKLTKFGNPYLGKSTFSALGATQILFPEISAKHKRFMTTISFQRYYDLTDNENK